MEDEPNKLDSIWRNPDGTFKKGHPPTSEGRPKVKTLKEYAREFLATLPEEQKTEFLAALQPEIVWKMAEGNPHTTEDITSGGEKIFVLPSELINKNGIRTNESTKSDSTGQPQIQSS